nr:RecName: Full=PI-stichotoxin-Hcr2k; Short=PI-SHTX-Hcr2k; AltName: Full=Kunitz-type serine protease inhibitor RmIn I [Heteractis crispa]
GICSEPIVVGPCKAG